MTRAPLSETEDRDEEAPVHRAAGRFREAEHGTQTAELS